MDCKRNAIRIISAVVAITCGVHAAPSVYWVSTPTLHNETVLVAGAGFTTATSVTLFHDPDTTNPVGKFPEPSSSWAGSVKFVLPTQCGPPCYAKLGTQNGTVVVPVNKPDVWWASAGTLSDGSSSGSDIIPVILPGSTLRVFGRALGWSDDGITCINASKDPAPNTHTNLVLSAMDKTTAQSVSAAAASCYEAAFQVPLDIHDSFIFENGPISAVIHTQWGNSTPFDVEISIPPAPSPVPPTIIDAVKDCGGDLHLAMRKAADLVAKGAIPIVELGHHDFILNSSLAVPDGVTLTGDSIDNSTLFFELGCPFDATDPVWSALSVGTDVSLTHFSLSVYVLGDSIPVRNNTERAGSVAIRMPPQASNLWIESLNVTVDGNASNAMRIEGTGFQISKTTLWQKNCSLVNGFESSTTLYTSGARDGIISDSVVRWRCSAYDLDTSERIILERNSFECNVTGSVPHGNSISGYGGRQGLPLNRWWAIFRNSFSRPACTELAPGQCGGPNWMQRETLTTDAGYGWAVGYITSQKLNTNQSHMVHVDWKAWSTEPTPGTSMVVLNGSGAGATRLIVAVHDNTTIQIDSPFDEHVSPESFIAVVSTYSQKIIAGNKFVWTEVIQFFGTTLQGVIADNTIENANVNHSLHTGDPLVKLHGGSLRAVGECYHGPAPVLFVEYSGNIMDRSDGVYLQDNHGPAYFQCGGKEGYLGPWIKWAVIRRNNLSGISLAAKAASLPPACPAIVLTDSDAGSVPQIEQFSSDIIFEHDSFQCNSDALPGGYVMNMSRCSHCTTRL